MKHSDFIKGIDLSPYDSYSEVWVISGFDYDECIDYFSNEYINQIQGQLTCLKHIKHISKRIEKIKRLLATHRTDVDDLSKDEGNGDGVVFYTPGEVDIFVMVLRKSLDKFKPLECQTIFHECLHVSQLFLPKFLDRDTEMEAEAYFIKRLFIEIINA